MEMCMPKKKIPNPPKKLSTAITWALSDLRKVEKQKKRYVVDMGEWNGKDYYDDKKCHVCFAGSVMVKRLKVKDGIGWPVNLLKGPKGRGWAHAFSALDAIRRGDVRLGFAYFADYEEDLNFKQEMVVRKFENNIPRYYDGPGRFKRKVESLARALKKVGL